LPESQIAVLIDYENVGLDSVQHLFDQLSDVGRIIVKRAYADWSAVGKKRDQVLELGIEAMHHFHSTRSAKNSSDICLVIDAVELLYRSPVDTFVIVSADSDFVPLASKLRAAGKTVIGAGRRDVVSPTLVKSCDRYIYLGVDVRPGPPAARGPEAAPGVRSAGADSLVRRALEADSQGKVPGSKLYQTVMRIDPSFNFKDLGYSTFARFLEGSPAVKVTRSRGAGDIQVELRSSGPTGVLPRVSAVLGRRRRPIAARAPAQEPERSMPEPSTPVSQALVLPPPMEPSTGASPETSALDAPTWDQQVHVAWSGRAGATNATLNGTWAAGEAARALGVPKLSASRHKTLQKLLDASPFLSQHWTRDGNTLHRK